LEKIGNFLNATEFERRSPHEKPKPPSVKNWVFTLKNLRIWQILKAPYYHGTPGPPCGGVLWKKKRIHHMCFQIRYLGMVKKNTYYVCNRNGFYKLNLQKPERQRALKLRGANKINASCPALLKIVAENEGRISVNYIQTRVGHDFEIGKLRLTASERQELAGE
jgi:hypothetical protein